MKKKVPILPFNLVKFTIASRSLSNRRPVGRNAPGLIPPATRPAVGGSWRRNSNSIPLSVMLAVSLLVTAAAERINAQDDTLPLAANVDQVRVNVAGRNVPVSYAPINGTLVRFLQGITYNRVLIKQNGGSAPIAETTGRLRLPVSGSPAFVEATFDDYVNDAMARSNLLQALRDQLQLGPAVSFQPARVLPGRSLRLIMYDPVENGKRVLLAEGPLTASASPQPIATFSLTADAISALAQLQAQVSDGASRLAILVAQEYEAIFRMVDVELSLDFVEDSLADLSQQLVPHPNTQRPHLAFAAYSNLQLSSSGTLDNETLFARMLRQAVRIAILQREGSQANEALVERLLDEALKLVNLKITVADQERQRAEATFLLDEGIQITTALPQLRSVIESIKTDQNREWSDAFRRAVQQGVTTTIGGDAGVNVGFFKLGGNVNTTFNWNDQSEVDRKRAGYIKRLEETAAQLEGGLPVLTGIRFDLNYRVSSINFASIEANIGSFTTGKATLETELPLSDYVRTLNQAPRIEALLVSRIEVGSTNVGSSENWTRNGTLLYKDVPVRFMQPFAWPPQVIAPISRVDSDARPNYIRLATEVRDVTETGFILRVTSKYDGQTAWIYGASASWTAVGERRLQPIEGGGFAGIGEPGGLPIIPGEIREQVLTPLLQSPLLADGRLTGMFNAIPGRSYILQASSDLRQWSPLGMVVAEDFEAEFSVPLLASTSQQFFRVITQ